MLVNISLESFVFPTWLISISFHITLQDCLPPSVAATLVCLWALQPCHPECNEGSLNPLARWAYSPHPSAHDPTRLLPRQYPLSSSSAVESCAACPSPD